MDYSQLSEQISNATGFYSNNSTGTHQQENTSSQYSGLKLNSTSPVPRPGSSSPVPMCSSCSHKQSLLENKEVEITRLECKVESLKHEVRDTNEKLRYREKMIERLENDHQAIILQV